MKILGINFGGKKDQPTKLHKNKEYIQSFNIGGFENDLIDNRNLSTPFIDDRRGNNFVYFGGDNLYPQHLVNLYLKSSFHSAIINFNTNILLKNDIIFEDESDNLENKIKKEKLKQIFDFSFLKSFLLDFYINKRIHINFKNGLPYIIDAQKVRYNIDKSIYYINENWVYRSFADIVEHKAFQNNTKNGVCSYMQLTKGVQHYPIPTYIGAANWIFLDANLSYFQKQAMINSVNISSTLTIFEDFETEEEQKKFFNNLKMDYEGLKNTGTMMVFKGDPNNPDTAPKFQTTEPIELDKSFSNVQETIVNNIAYAHNTAPILLGVATAGKLGATQELEDTFKLYKNSVMLPNINLLNTYLTDIAKKYGYKGKVTFDKNINLF